MARRPTRRRLHWAAYLWPGLPHLWNGGSWAGLVLAVAFTVLLNTLIVATLVWPEWLAERTRLACGLSVAAIWLAALWETRAELRRQAAHRAQEALDDGADQQNDQQSGEEAQTDDTMRGRADAERIDQLFRVAQQQYLRADWLAAEKTLGELLKIDRQDVEAQLLRAAIWRQTDRPARATRLLEHLSRRKDAEAWAFEIQDEQQRIRRKTASGETENAAA